MAIRTEERVYLSAEFYKSYRGLPRFSDIWKLQIMAAVPAARVQDPVPPDTLCDVIRSVSTTANSRFRRFSKIKNQGSKRRDAWRCKMKAIVEDKGSCRPTHHNRSHTTVIVLHRLVFWAVTLQI